MINGGTVETFCVPKYAIGYSFSTTEWFSNNYFNSFITKEMAAFPDESKPILEIL